MDWLSEVARWANANEGLLQALAIVAGIGAPLLCEAAHQRSFEQTLAALE